ncbi:MAG: peptide ABC transporter substrate-binding protein [Acidobacteriota bacterium]
MRILIRHLLRAFESVGTLTALLILVVTSISCSTARSRYFGYTNPPQENILRYVSGPEPESLDPQIPTGQPETRILLSLYDGLVDYHPETMEPIPALAKSWDLSEDGRTYTFHLRSGARFSNGEPITAEDFVYTFTRGLSPELASQNASFGYYIENAEEYNSGSKPASSLGLRAIDDLTLEIRLKQPTPFFVGLLCHPFFRVIHKETVEKFGREWVRSENIVTSGAFNLLEHRPYDRLVVVKNPLYWDAEMVRLDRIEFYPLEDTNTMMNLYRSGQIDAFYNHVPPASWNAEVRAFEDEYLDFPELVVDYYTFNTLKAPMNDLRVRRAFSLAIDREAMSKFRRTTQPLAEFSPKGIFPDYDAVRESVFSEERTSRGISEDEWTRRKFDPEAARRMLGEAGYPVIKTTDGFSCPTFPVDQVEFLYNTAESNRVNAEYVQAQWKQNLGITVPLRNQEFKAFLQSRTNLDYSGIARGGWAGDYLDPLAFLKILYGKDNESATGWSNSEFDNLLDRANEERNPEARFALLARAEFLMLLDQPVLPVQTAATNWMKKPFVKGLYPNPGTLHTWKFVYIERNSEKWDSNVAKIMDQRDDFVDENLDRLMKTKSSVADVSGARVKR